MVTRREVLEVFLYNLGYPEYDMVDGSQEAYARHVCFGGNSIQVLPKETFSLTTMEGMIYIDYYRCPVCGKVIIDKNFM